MFITGASRGIGKAIALKCAKDGANVVIAAKTVQPHPKLPGTIFTAAKESKLENSDILHIYCHGVDREIDATIFYAVTITPQPSAVIGAASQLSFTLKFEFHAFSASLLSSILLINGENHVILGFHYHCMLCVLVEDAGGKCLACEVDIRNEDQVIKAVDEAVKKFGGIDILINNASAISLTNTTDTPMKRFDLMNGVNMRGTFIW